MKPTRHAPLLIKGAFQGYQEHGERHGDLGDLNFF
jgi:hypothetical protein